jgi:Skp family chaperone for outer membrane proteins
MTMRRFAPVSVLLGLLITAPTFAQNAPGAAPTPAPAASAEPGPTRIGVMNMDRVFQDLQEAKDIRARQESEQKEFKDLQAAHKAELDGMVAEISQLKPDSPQYEDKTTALQQKSVQYELELKLKQLNMGREQNKLMKSVYDEIEAACADIAKKRGLDLVMSQVRPEFPPNVQDQNPDAIRTLIQQRTMIYVSPTIDITSDVITALDAKYRANGK